MSSSVTAAVAGAGVPEALLGALLLLDPDTPRICSTATKSTSLNCLARFFRRVRRFSAFRKLFVTFFLASLIAFCSAFNRAMDCNRASDSNTGTVTPVGAAAAAHVAAEVAGPVLGPSPEAAAAMLAAAPLGASTSAPAMLLDRQGASYPGAPKPKNFASVPTMVAHVRVPAVLQEAMVCVGVPLRVQHEVKRI